MRRNCSKITVRLILISIIGFGLIGLFGCGQQGAPGGQLGATASISLNPGATSLPADGVSSTSITAVLTDSSGAAVNENTSVTFKTDLGTFNNGKTTISAATPSTSGTVTISFVAGTTAGTAHITATSNDVSQQVSIQIVKPSPSLVTLSTSTDSVVADGVANATLTATVTDSSDNRVPNVTVTFQTTIGDLDGSKPGPQTTLTVQTSDNGEAVAHISSTNLGVATVTATVEGASGQTTITFVPGPLAKIIVSASPNNLAADGTSTSTITATATDALGNLVSDGWVINFTPSANLSAASVPTTNGTASVIYTATTTPGSVTITASSDDYPSISAPVTITLVDVSVSSISVKAGASSITADGTSHTSITATAVGSNGTIPDGTEVSFTTTAGDLDSNTPGIQSTITAPTTGGIAHVNLTSPTSLGSATITATLAGVSNTTSVSFVAGAPDNITLSPQPGNLTADGSSKSTVGIVVLDAHDNPVNNATLTLSADTGSINNLNVTTVNGQASVMYTAPSSVPASGNATVTATAANGVSGYVSITLFGQQVASITLTASPTSLPADGSSTSTISAKVALSGGGAVSDGTKVNFSIVSGGGSISPSSRTSAGIALATLTAGDAAGTATIRAEAGGRVAELPIEYTPGSVSLTIVPNSILGTGDKTAEVTVTVLKADGTPIADGTDVALKLDDNSLGVLDPADTTTTDGIAKTEFIGAAKGGTATISASAEISGVTVTGSGTIQIQAPPSNIQAEAPTNSSIAIYGTGGVATSQVVFDVTDQSGNPVADGYLIDFSIQNGPEGVGIEPTSAITSGGKVSTIVRSGSKAGTVVIQATYHNNSNVSTVSNQITISNGPPVGEEFSIAAEYLNISGLWIDGIEDNIPVQAKDISGNPVPPTSIFFSTNNTGGMISPGSAVTGTGDTAGRASNTLVTGDPAPLNGFMTVTAEAQNGGRTTHVTSIAVTPDDPGTPGTDESKIMYVGTDGGGVYKSIDGGGSWTNISGASEQASVGQAFIDPYVNDVAIDPDSPNNIYAATGYLGKGHIYRSLDGGDNWNSGDPEEWHGLLTLDNAVLSVLCDKGSSYIWAGTNGMGVWYSTDGNSFMLSGRHVTVPSPDSSNIGNGTMSTPTLGNNALPETWTATYKGSYWLVRGSTSGFQNNYAATGIPYSSDYKQVSFTITAGGTAFAVGDSFTFTVYSDLMGVVRKVVKASSFGGTAVLYAATPTGVYKSSDGGDSWAETTNFVGDNITALRSNPSNPQIVYAGTRDAGVWYTADGGTTWIQVNDGLGQGLSATTPVSAAANQGDGVINSVSAYGNPATQTENWTLTYDATNTTFYAQGTVTPYTPPGLEAVEVSSTSTTTTYDVYRNDSGLPADLLFSFVVPNNLNFEDGDSFTFSTLRDPGMYIKALLVDDTNHYLYAATYFNGAAHAVGNVYSIPLSLGAPSGEWSSANTGLPEYSADDKTLFAQHALACNHPSDPTSLFVGGEGIHFYKATSGLDSGSPTWVASETGLSNLIMARMPILFTDKVTMNISDSGWDGTSGHYVTYLVYIQDRNDNPPVAGCGLMVTVTDASGKVKTIFDMTYPDAYTYQGTGEYPFVISWPINSGDKVAFTFTSPDNTAPDPPGSSGNGLSLYYQY